MNTRARTLSLPVLVHVFLLRPFLKLFFGVDVAGRINLSRLGQYIIVANHNSHLDILLLFLILPIRQIRRTHPVAAKEYFSKRKIVFKLACWLFRPIWIVRGEKVEDPLKEMREKLSSGHSLIIFPEGTRGTPGQIGRFKSGVGRLAVDRRDIPIIPVFLSGPERAFPKKSAIPLPIWNFITVGPPQFFMGESPDITASLEKTIRELAESETANRHRRHKHSQAAFAVAVLGIDGSGKSTLSRKVSLRLSKTFRVCLVSDGLQVFEKGSRKEIQPLLTERVREAVGRHAKTAQSLKAYKIPKMAELFLRDRLLGEVKRWYSPDIIVLDGCPLANLTAWARLYKEEYLDNDGCTAALMMLSGKERSFARDNPLLAKFPELTTLKRLKLTHLKIPDAAIMLDVDPAVSMARIESRGERVQVHETVEKLAKLREGYLMVCRSLEEAFNIPALILAGESDIETLSASALEFIETLYGGRMAHG
jgi:1-acyl-sn-glycerol-3-phosphate acyltransferase